jgi:Tol biopolymer transport system component
VLAGEPFKIAEHVSAAGLIGGANSGLSSCESGLAFRSGAVVPERALIWFDRRGKEIGRIGDAGEGINNPALSIDGKRLALRRVTSGNWDIWVFDIEKGFWTRATDDDASDSYPVWSSDGTRIAYVSVSAGQVKILVKQAASLEAAGELLFSTQGTVTLADWSRDGHYLLYTQGSSVWLLPLDGDRKPTPVVQTRFRADMPQFSPDGTSIAYEYNASGRREVYLQPISSPGDRVPVSAAGGTQVRWRSDGSELFYVAGDGRLMSVPIVRTGKRLEPGAPVALFAAPIAGADVTPPGGTRQQYAVSPDGQRFLFLAGADEQPPPPITLILNWKPARRKESADR